MMSVSWIFLFLVASNKNKFMNLSGIISISGKSGLFKVVAQGKNNIIVESLIDGKRSPAYSSDRISALEDISIYTIEDDFPLKEVFALIFKKENGTYEDILTTTLISIEDLRDDGDKHDNRI